MYYFIHAFCIDLHFALIKLLNRNLVLFKGTEKKRSLNTQFRVRQRGCRGWHCRGNKHINSTILVVYFSSKTPQCHYRAKAFVQAHIEENIKAPCHWHLLGESTSDWWIPITKVQCIYNVGLWEWGSRHVHQILNSHKQHTCVSSRLCVFWR